jgi:hypothetical protein
MLLPSIYYDFADYLWQHMDHTAPFHRFMHLTVHFLLVGEYYLWLVLL